MDGAGQDQRLDERVGLASAIKLTEDVHAGSSLVLSSVCSEIHNVSDRMEASDGVMAKPSHAIGLSRGCLPALSESPSALP